MADVTVPVTIKDAHVTPGLTAFMAATTDEIGNQEKQ
jgi:hypothetical protein